MQEFLSVTHDVDEMLTILQKRLIKELKLKYPDYVDSEYLVFAMQDIFMYTNHPFVILIDEWDCLFREYKQNKDAQKKYLDFYSALNMFTEYSMTNPREMTEFFGFTEREVYELCRQYKRNFEETKVWYDGYRLTKSEDSMPQMRRYFEMAIIIV